MKRKKWLVLVVLGVTAVVIVSVVRQQFSMQLHGSNESVHAEILRYVPLDTPIEEAKRTMEGHGFKCRFYKSEADPSSSVALVGLLGSPTGHGPLLAPSVVIDRSFYRAYERQDEPSEPDELFCYKDNRSWSQFFRDPIIGYGINVTFYCENGVVKGVKIVRGVTHGM